MIRQPMVLRGMVPLGLQSTVAAIKRTPFAFTFTTSSSSRSPSLPAQVFRVSPACGHALLKQHHRHYRNRSDRHLWRQPPEFKRAPRMNAVEQGSRFVVRLCSCISSGDNAKVALKLSSILKELRGSSGGSALQTQSKTLYATVSHVHTLFVTLSPCTSASCR